MDRLLRIYGDACGLGGFASEWRRVAALLEYAYVVSRYLPFRARREDAEDALAFAEAALAVFQCLERL